MENKKRVNLTVRVADKIARRFKSRCALEGITGQEVLAKAVEDYAMKKDKKKSE